MKKITIFIGCLMLATASTAEQNAPLEPGVTPLKHLTWAYETSKILISRNSDGVPTHVSFAKCESCKQDSFRLSPNVHFYFNRTPIAPKDTALYQGKPGVVELNKVDQAVSISFDLEDK